MKRFKLFLIVVLISAGFLHAQNRQLLYDFYEIPQSLLLNPGVKTPYKWHTGIPVVSGISVQAGTSGITVNDLFSNDGLSFTDKVRDRVVNRLDEKDEFVGSGQIELFNGGFRTKNSPDTYYSFGIYGEGFVSQFWPRDIAILAFEGNANYNRRFDLSHIASQGEAVNVFHFGINKRLNNTSHIGFRGKIYSSLFNFRSAGNNGYFETTPGENNVLRNTLVADVELKTSGVQGFLDILDDNTISARAEFPRRFLQRSFFGGDLGLGFDIGFTKKINERTVITGSLLDVGFIYYSTDVKNYTLEGSAFTEGIEVVLPRDVDDLDTDLWQTLIDDVEAQIPFETNTDSYVSLRPIKLNASIRYNFGDNGKWGNGGPCYCPIRARSNKGKSNFFDYKNSIGGQVFVINRLRGPQAAITAFYQTRIGNALAIKATYTADKFTATNIGLGLNLQAGPINFYLLGDNLLGYGNLPDSNYASLQFGFNIISWNGN